MLWTNWDPVSAVNHDVSPHFDQNLEIHQFDKPQITGTIFEKNVFDVFFFMSQIYVDVDNMYCSQPLGQSRLFGLTLEELYIFVYFYMQFMGWTMF